MRPPLGPGGRPFRGLRILPLLSSLVAVGVNAVVLLSDRAPGFLRRLSSRIDAGVSRASDAAGIDLSRGAAAVPRSDFDVHVAIWAVAALLVGLASWSWLSLLLANGLVFAASVVLEAAQATYTHSRAVQLSDVLANAVGVLLGTLAVAAFSVVWGIVFPGRPTTSRSR